MDPYSTRDRRLPANAFLTVLLCLAAVGARAAGVEPYAEERLQPSTLATLLGAGVFVVLLVTVGLLLVVRGLREDLRDRRRSYRRRSRRVSQRPPAAPAG